MNTPAGLAFAPDGTLFVADYGYNRILVFPPGAASSKSNPIAAIDVIGQPDFRSVVSTSANHPYGLAFDERNNALWVTCQTTNVFVKYSNIIAQVNNNVTSVPVTVTFPNRTPKAIISPKGNIFLKTALVFTFPFYRPT